MSRSARTACLALAWFASCRATISEPALPPAWSQARAQEPLSRDDCVELALQSAPNAAAWQARNLAARAHRDQAQLLANPIASLAWEDFGLNQAAAQSVVQTTLSLALSLEDVFARKRRAAAARYELEAQEADLRAEIVKLAAEVARDYDALVASRARVRLREELAAVAERQRADVQQFVSNGLAPRFDLERAEAELEQSRAQLAKAQGEARSLELEFAFALGFERPVALQLSDPLTSAGAATSRDLSDLLASAARMRAEISAATARYRAELERLRLSAERVQFLPTVGAGPRKQGSELRGIATIDVALPIFDSGAAAERVQQASLLAAAAALRSSAHAVAREVCAASERLDTAEAYLSEHARSLDGRRRALREGTERLFRAGEVQYPELALARRDEVEARIALLDAELAAATARVDLDAASGALRTPYDRQP